MPVLGKKTKTTSGRESLGLHVWIRSSTCSSAWRRAPARVPPLLPHGGVDVLLRLGEVVVVSVEGEKEREEEMVAAERKEGGVLGLELGEEGALLVFLWGRSEPGWRREWRGTVASATYRRERGAWRERKGKRPAWAGPLLG